MSNLYCDQCGYNLANLPESICPECGRGFDASALRARSREPYMSRRWWVLLVVLPAAICLVPQFIASAFGILRVEDPAIAVGVIAFYVCVLGMPVYVIVTAIVASIRFSRLRLLKTGTKSTALYHVAMIPTLAFGQAVLAAVSLIGGCALTWWSIDGLI